MWKILITFLILISHLHAYHLRMKKSNHSYLTTVKRLVYILKKNGFTIHSTIVYSRYLKKGKGVLVSFSHPALTALLVNQDPRCGLDLPLRILVLQSGRSVYLLYHSPLELYDNYHINKKTIQKLSRIFAHMITAATR